MSRALRTQQNAEAGGRASVKPLLEAGATAAQGERERHDWVRCGGRAAVAILSDVECIQRCPKAVPRHGDAHLLTLNRVHHSPRLVSGVVLVVGGDGDPAAVHQASAQAASPRRPLGGTMANSRSLTHSRAWIVPRHATTTSQRPRAAFPSSVVDPVAPCVVVEAGSHREGQYGANGGRI